jgi:LCP family protein required for cell wall assembly
LPEYQNPAKKLFTRYLIGALMIVVAVATASAWAAVNEVEQVVEAFEQGGNLDFGEEVAEADIGKPQTIMLVGSDQRAKGAADFEAGARSDTLILVRLDPEKKRTALLSLPRDLKVEIPGHGTDKLNAAYSLGGPKLTLKTVKQLTGLTVNHVINVDFGGFREAVNAIGCVYVDIDRTYFNNNMGGGEQYATINVPQGYQKLCGADALDYVRYRHEDSDLVRGARQQDFIRQAKEQVGVGKIISDRRKLTKIFGRYTESDLDKRKEIVRFLRLVAGMAQHPVAEIRFTGEAGPSYVTISDRKLRKLVDDFLGTKDTPGGRGTLEPKDPKERKRAKKEIASNLEVAKDAGRLQALGAIAEEPGLPVYYPTRRTQGAQYGSQAPRVYDIKVGKKKYRSYRMTIKRDKSLGEYYGLQGTQWKDPPILKGADQTKKIGRRTFELFYDGDRVRLVAWRTDEGVYWVSNTLLQTLSRKQMLEIASTTRILGQ